MKPENLKKVTEAIMDEFGCNEKLAEFSAKAAMDGVNKALIEVVNKLYEPKEGE